jgi:hypothetical protein
LLVAAPAFAQDAKVHVEAQVVLTQVAGNSVDPQLKGMQEALGKKVHYGTLKKLSSERIELSSKPHTLKLPNGKDVALSVEHIKDDVATLRVRVPPSDTTYKLGHSASLYVQAGPHEGGDLWLVLAPAK